MMTVAIIAQAAEADIISGVEIDGLIYSLDKTNKTATVTGIGTGAKTTLDISKVTYDDAEYTVTAIGENAFKNSTIVSATFPEVLTIGNS